MSHNAIGHMMADISVSAGTSKRYTNHCLRGTCVTVLDEYFYARHIMSVSLHKSEAFIRSYSHNTSMAQKRKMAETTSKTCGLSDKTPPSNAFAMSASSVSGVSYVQNATAIASTIFTRPEDPPLSLPYDADLIRNYYLIYQVKTRFLVKQISQMYFQQCR